MRPRRSVVLTALVGLLCGGCAALPYASMSPEQINALAKIKDASIGCVSGVYAGAKITTVVVNVDKGMPTGITVKEDCGLVFDNKPPAKP